MAHIFVYNYEASSWYSPPENEFDINMLKSLCPNAQVQRPEDVTAFKNLCGVAMVNALWNSFSVYIEDDGEALAFMLIQDQFVKQNSKYDDRAELRMILENPDWDDIMSESDTIRSLERSSRDRSAKISNVSVASAKRKFKKFKSEIEFALRAFTPEFKKHFDEFENMFTNECEAYTKAIRDNGREVANAKSRLKNRLNKYVVKKVERRK